MNVGRAFSTAAAGFFMVMAAAVAHGQTAAAGGDDPAALMARLRSAVDWLAAPEREEDLPRLIARST